MRNNCYCFTPFDCPACRSDYENYFVYCNESGLFPAFISLVFTSLLGTDLAEKRWYSGRYCSAPIPLGNPTEEDFRRYNAEII